MSQIPSANRQIARAAGTVMLAFLFGQLTGLARSILVAGAFGASPELDAFLAANRVPETLFSLIAGGALGSAFIPTFTGLLAKDQRESAWRLASSIANSVLLTLSTLAICAAVFAPQIVRYALAPGFATDPSLFALTVALLRIQLASAVLFGLGGLLIGILNAHQVFWIPALTPAMYQLGIIFGVLVLAPSMGIFGLAWGVMIGAVLYIVIQIPSLLKVFSKAKGITDGTFRDYFYLVRNYNFSPGLNNPAVREVVFLMGPRLMGVAVVQLNFWVNTWLASQMPFGSVTALYYGFSLMLMAQIAIAQSIAIAAMPTFSAQHALGRMDEMRTALASSLRGVILLALPASIGLILLREPLVSLLYERREFDERSVQLVTWSLLWFAGGLLGHSIMEILTRAFYAQHDTKTPVMIGILAMGLNVFFSFTFSRYFAQIGWMPHGGLALANSLATALEAAALFIVMRTRLGGMEGHYLLRGIGAAALAGFVMTLGLLAWNQAANHLSIWIIAVGGVAIGGLIYGTGVSLLKIREVTGLILALRRRLER